VGEVRSWVLDAGTNGTVDELTLAVVVPMVGGVDRIIDTELGDAGSEFAELNELRGVGVG